MEQYEIQDSKGCIHSFTDKHEADTAWDAMTMYDEEGKERYTWLRFAALKEKYFTSWEGDLKLVQVHRIYK